MASGIIISLSCPICGEIVWEDDYVFLTYMKVFVHPECKIKLKQLLKGGNNV